MTGSAFEVPTSGPLSSVHAGERPFAFPRPASGSALGRGSDAVDIYLTSIFASMRLVPLLVNGSIVAIVFLFLLCHVSDTKEVCHG